MGLEPSALTHAPDPERENVPRDSFAKIPQQENASDNSLLGQPTLLGNVGLQHSIMLAGKDQVLKQHQETHEMHMEVQDAVQATADGESVVSGLGEHTHEQAHEQRQSKPHLPGKSGEQQPGATVGSAQDIQAEAHAQQQIQRAALQRAQAQAQAQQDALAQAIVQAQADAQADGAAQLDAQEQQHTDLQNRAGTQAQNSEGVMAHSEEVAEAAVFVEAAKEAVTVLASAGAGAGAPHLAAQTVASAPAQLQAPAAMQAQVVVQAPAAAPPAAQAQSMSLSEQNADSGSTSARNGEAEPSRPRETARDSSAQDSEDKKEDGDAHKTRKRPHDDGHGVDALAQRRKHEARGIKRERPQDTQDQDTSAAVPADAGSVEELHKGDVVERYFEETGTFLRARIKKIYYWGDDTDKKVTLEHPGAIRWGVLIFEKRVPKVRTWPTLFCQPIALTQTHGDPGGLCMTCADRRL